MRKSPFIPIVALAAITVMAAAAIAQDPKTPDIVGTWIGAAVVEEDGSGFDLTVVFDKVEGAYVGKLSDAGGMIPETPLREIVFKDNKLTCEIDLPPALGSQLVRIELRLEGETLKGAWFDAEGNSGALELALKK